MILILACNNCHRTNAVKAVTESVNLPPKETYLIWDCLRCRKQHRWLIPRGRGLKNTARQSIKNSIAYGKRGSRKDVYIRLAEAPPEAHRKILFGELIWWWREEAGRTQDETAALAGIDVRQWRRIEAGQNKPQRKNLKKIVSAVSGIIEQAYLLTDSDKILNSDLERRLAEEEKQISPSAHFHIDPENFELPPDESKDVEIALRQLRRALPTELDTHKFLFFTYMVYQEYWGRRQSAPITIDDNSIEVIPAVKNLIDILARCENTETQYRVVDVIAKEVAFLMTKPKIADLMIQFINTTFISAADEHETRRRVGEQWKQLRSMEKLILTLFDRVDSQHQSGLIAACQKLHSSAKETDIWFLE
ncbi:MAG TPA: helix-turn-helix transcriptional regulator [Pyrinomonadaceae bacterium]|jgi:transcriptional regulator with XRE-family HTH domain